jgi:hypothetical protein
VYRKRKEKEKIKIQQTSNFYLSFCHHLVSVVHNRGEDFLEINQSETRIACGGHVC